LRTCLASNTLALPPSAHTGSEHIVALLTHLRCCMYACCMAAQAGTESAQHPQLYTVLEQRKASVGTGLLGTDHTYVIPGAEAGKRK
jgi:hypothetical protein